MRVLVIGSTRGTGRLLVDRLVAGGHDVVAMVRDPSQADDRRQAGAEPVVGDLEGELRPAFDGVEAVAFCAGSGSRTGPDATLRVDLHGAVRTIDLAVEGGVPRYVMLSSMRADDPLRGGETIRHYYAAKHAADRILSASGLDATIVRPGRLTDDDGRGLVTIGVPRLDDSGTIPRADVAEVLAGCLGSQATIGATFDVLSGDTPIPDALGSLGH